MRISKPWSEFDQALTAQLSSSKLEDDEAILQAAALKRKAELEDEFDVELTDKVILAMLDRAKKKARHSSSGMLRCIRRWELDEEFLED
jgi:hypothetical protein